jgi:hypothetical protein
MGYRQKLGSLKESCLFLEPVIVAHGTMLDMVVTEQSRTKAFNLIKNSVDTATAAWPQWRIVPSPFQPCKSKRHPSCSGCTCLQFQYDPR